MQLPPFEVLSSWPTPDYENPETHGPAGYAVVLSLTSLATLILAIRFYTRKQITKGFGLDDKLIAAAYIPAVSFAVASTIAQFNYGWGTRIWDVPFTMFAPGLKMSLLTYNLFNAASCLTKLSILATFYRLLGPSRPKMKLFVRVLGGVITFNSILFCMVVLLQCQPLSNFWDIFASPRKCIDEAKHLLSAGCINTTTDIIVVALPITTVMGLQLPRQQRVVVVVLFSFGFLACAAGVIRTYITWVMTVDYDITWHAWSVVVSSAVELYVGIICASIPATKPFFVSYLPRKFDSARHQKSLGTADTSDSASLAARRRASKSAPIVSCEDEEALRSPTPTILSPHAVPLDRMVTRPPPSVCSSSPSRRSSSRSWRNTWPLPVGDHCVGPRDGDLRGVVDLEEGRAVRDHV